MAKDRLDPVEYYGSALLWRRFAPIFAVLVSAAGVVLLIFVTRKREY